jgi:hypothetical protein
MIVISRSVHSYIDLHTRDERAKVSAQVQQVANLSLSQLTSAH